MGDGRSHYPVLLDLQDRLCVVVGGGRVGERKVSALLPSGARVRVISPQVTDALRSLSDEGRIQWTAREFVPADVDGADLVFAATHSRETNSAVCEVSRAGHALVNNATAETNDFIVPATVQQGGLQIAISTGGGSPAYAKLVRKRLEEMFGPEHAEFVALLESLRPRVMARFPDDEKQRRSVWNRIVRWETLDWMRQGRTQDVEELITACLS